MSAVIDSLLPDEWRARMLKLFGGIFLGAFVGALVVEILRKRRPEVLENLEKRAKFVSDKLFEKLGDDFGLRSSDGKAPTA
jgi:hypothetical protein